MLDSFLELTILDELRANTDLASIVVVFAAFSAGIGVIARAYNRRWFSWTITSFFLSLLLTPVGPLAIFIVAEMVRDPAEGDSSRRSRSNQRQERVENREEVSEGSEVAEEQRARTPNEEAPRKEELTEDLFSEIDPLRVPAYDELTGYLAEIPNWDSTLPRALKAFRNWFQENRIPFLGSSDDRVHIPPQLFFFKREDRAFVGRKWSLPGFPIDSVSELARQSYKFGRSAAVEERPQIFLLVFENRGASDERRLIFQVVHRGGESDLRLCNLIGESNGSVGLGESYSQEFAGSNLALDIAKSFWLGAGVDVGLRAPDLVTVEDELEEDRTENEKEETDAGPNTDVSFEVSTSYERSSASAKDLVSQSRSTWVPPGNTVTVGGRRVSGGMIYAGTKLQPVDGYQESDPTLLNPDLKVHSRKTDPEGQNLNYWPSYSSIPPASRGAYLDWLASGRRGEDYDIGYVFLFFYGLERRILFDAQHDERAKEEIPILIEELEKLKETYGGHSGSFRGYCDRLLAYTRCAFGFEESLTSPTYDTETERYRMSRPEKIALGQLVKAKEPIPAEWALAWVRSDPEVRLRTPGRRCQQEFDALFRRRYSEEFGEGITVEAGRNTLTVSYRPASGGIQEAFTERIEGAVDIDRIAIPPDLQEYASSIEEGLDDYSRWIGRRDDRTSLAALGQLPNELVQDRAGEDAREFVEQIEEWMASENRAVISSKQLLEYWPSKNEDYLTKTEAEALSGFLAGFDFGIEPDVRYTRNPSKRDHLTIFRLRGPDEVPEEPFRSARLLVHLAAAVAGADDEIAPGEEEHIERHLEETLDLGKSERDRLRAHLARLLEHTPSLRGVRRRAEDLSEDQRRRLATFLLTLAGADGYLDGEEITLLEKIYDILGLDENQVHQDLHGLSARDPGTPDEGPVTVIEADEKETYRVPDEDETHSSEKAQATSDEEGIDLDLDRVSEVQDETRDVAGVLDDVFSDDEEEEGSPSFSIDGLTEAHEEFLVDLGEKVEWTRAEFNELAEHHGLMPGFAIEQINERAFEVTDEPLLEGEDPIELNPHAFDALQ